MKNNEPNVCLFGVDIYCYFILELIRFLLVNRNYMKFVTEIILSFLHRNTTQSEN